MISATYSLHSADEVIQASFGQHLVITDGPAPSAAQSSLFVTAHKRISTHIRPLMGNKAVLDLRLGAIQGMQAGIVCGKHQGNGSAYLIEISQAAAPPTRKAVRRVPPQHGRAPHANEVLREVAAEGDTAPHCRHPATVGMISGTALRTPRHALPRVVEAIEAEMAKIVEPTGGEPAIAEDDAAVEHEPVALKTHAIPAELPNC